MEVASPALAAAGMGRGLGMPLTLVRLRYYRAAIMIRTGFSIGAALLWLLISVVRGGEPTAEPGYVLLRDLAVLRGTVEEEPGRVVIRDQGSEIRLSREKVACWADSLDGLYQYQLDRRRVFTVETHLDAARWCLRHGLCDRAAAEIVAAERLRPDHPELRRVETELRLAMERKAVQQAAWQSGAKSGGQAAAAGRSGEPATRRSNPDSSVTQNNSGENDGTGNDGTGNDGTGNDGTGNDGTGNDGTGNPAAGPPGREEDRPLSEMLAGVGGNALREFNLRIQPLLANRCSATACHGGGAATAWVMATEPLPGRRPSSSMTQQNLADVLPWVNQEHPMASPLLVRALQPHGGADEPPLGPRDQQAIENLRRWIASLRSEPSHAAKLRAAEPPPLPAAGGALPPSDVSFEDATVEYGASAGGSSAGGGRSVVPSVSGKAHQPVRLPDVADPFDPELFNRRFHPSARTAESSPIAGLDLDR